jgi:hypothetical protein
MDVAKILGAINVPLLGFIVSSYLDKTKFGALQGVQKIALLIAFGCFLVSIGLYILTVYAYDSLLMPTSFWQERLPRSSKKRHRWLVWRPPSSAAWVLYQNMIRIWRYRFTSANVAVFLGLIALVLAVFSPYGLDMKTLLLGMLVFAILLGVYIWFWYFSRPILGTED